MGDYLHEETPSLDRSKEGYITHPNPIIQEKGFEENVLAVDRQIKLYMPPLRPVVGGYRASKKVFHSVTQSNIFTELQSSFT